MKIVPIHVLIMLSATQNGWVVEIQRDNSWLIERCAQFKFRI